MTHYVSPESIDNSARCLLQRKFDFEQLVLQAGSVAAAAGICNSSNKNHGSSSQMMHPSASRSSWTENIMALSRDLQVICGNPTKSTQQNAPHSPVTLTRPPFQRNMSLTTIRTRPSSAAFPSILQSPSGAIGSSATIGRMRTLRRFDSQDVFSQHHHQFHQPWRRILVRHEETKSLLDQQLARVLKPDDGEPKHCLQKPYEHHRRSDTDVMTPMETEAKQITKTGFLFKVALEKQCVAEDLFLCWIEDRTLQICSAGGGISILAGDPIILGELTLPTEVPLHSLVCSVTDDLRWLYVQERQQATIVDFSSTCTSKYLPLWRENDMTSQLDIIFKIPSEFEHDDVIVKTVDDTIVITGIKKSFTISLGCSDGGSGGRSSPAFGLAATPSWPPLNASQYFQVVIPLPSGAQRRTISACITGHKHLIVTGKLRPAKRRYTL